MKLTRHRAPDRDEIVFTLTITGADYDRARLFPFDRMLLRECEDGSIADKLLGLETMARRVEEAYARSGS